MFLIKKIKIYSFLNPGVGKKKPSRNYFSKFEVAQGWPLEKKIGPIGPPPGKNIGAIDGEKKPKESYIGKQFLFDKSNFLLTHDFLSSAVRCGALALAFVPIDGGKKLKESWIEKQFLFDKSNFLLTQDFLSSAVRCGALAFVPGFFFPPRG